MCIWVVIAVVLLLFCFFRCEETVVTETKKEEKRSVGVNIKALVTNKYFWCVLGLWSIQVIHMTIVGTICPITVNIFSEMIRGCTAPCIFWKLCA